jgi:hypothetical protein
MTMKDIMLTVIHFIQTMMNFLIISRQVTVEGPVTLHAGPFGMVWGTSHNRLETKKVVQKLNYLHNNNVYTYVSNSMTPKWPPEEPPRDMGFRLAIKSAEVVIKENRGRKCDVTQEIKRLAGPRGDWHQRRFSPKDVFGVDCSIVMLTDILGRVREVGVDESFYESSPSTSASEAK